MYYSMGQSSAAAERKTSAMLYGAGVGLTVSFSPFVFDESVLMECLGSHSDRLGHYRSYSSTTS
jgi:hypothetical protein